MSSNKNWIVVVGLMVFGVFARLIPHIPNFTPTESIAIFGAAYLGFRYLSYLLPLSLIFISDFVINNTIARPFFPEKSGIIWFDSYMIYTALAIVSIVFISKLMLRKVNFKNVLATVISGTIIFYLFTNFAAWAMPASIYPSHPGGLMMAYIAGLPFLKISLLGNLVFSGIMFGSMYLIEQKLANKQSTIA